MSNYRIHFDSITLRPGCGMVMLLSVLMSGCASLDPTQRFGEPTNPFLDGSFEGGFVSPAEDPLGDMGRSGTDQGSDRLILRGTGRFIGARSWPGVDETDGEITLNFENTDIRQVVQIMLGDLLGLNYAMDPDVSGTATLQTSRPLRRELLIPTLETLLRMNEAALVERDGGYEVVPISIAARGRIVPQLGESGQALPRGYSLEILPLRYIAATEMAQILDPILPQGGLLRVDSRRNLLILAGTSNQIRTLRETVNLFDVDWMAGLSVGFFKLRFAEAPLLVEQLRQLLGEDGTPNERGPWRFIPMDRANALLVVGPEAAALERIGDWVEQLDQAAATGDDSQRLFVYRVRHGDAEKLAELLTRVFQAAREGSSALVGQVDPSRPAIRIGEPLTDVGGGASSIRGGALALTQQASIVADQINNSLLISATPKDYRSILEALEKLDIPPLQVLVEATIVEILLSGDLRYGVQWRFNQSISGYGSEASLRFDAEGPSPQFTAGAPSFNWSMIDDLGTVRSVLSALARDDLVNVLSSPSVMVMDNQEAKLQVGAQVPIATQQQQSTDVTGRIINSISYRDTGVILAVTPRVTPGGMIQLQINQEVSTPVDLGTSLDSPSFRTRNITSTVAVRSNQAVVLGGLIEDRRENSKAGLPGLHAVPILGALFGQRRKSAERTELVVILTPRIIIDDQDIQTVTEDFRRKVRNLEARF